MLTNETWWRLACAALSALCLTACNGAGQRQPGELVLQTGQERTRVERALRASGAREARLDFLAVDERDRKGAEYGLADGRLLAVTYRRRDRTWRLSRMEVCGNPEQPKARRAWRSVERLELTR